MQRQADYEKLYKPLEAAPQPSVTAVELTVDLYPAEQRVRMRGHYDLVNRNAVPVEDAHLFFFRGDRLEATQLDFDPPAQQTKVDERIGLRSFHFAKPMPPGATGRLTFDLTLPDPWLPERRGRRPTSSTTAPSSTAVPCCRSSATATGAS